MKGSKWHRLMRSPYITPFCFIHQIRRYEYVVLPLSVLTNEEALAYCWPTHHWVSHFPITVVKTLKSGMSIMFLDGSWKSARNQSKSVTWRNLCANTLIASAKLTYSINVFSLFDRFSLTSVTRKGLTPSLVSIFEHAVKSSSADLITSWISY